MIRRFRLRQGWTLELHTPPDSMGRTPNVPPFEVLLRQPPMPLPELQIGLSCEGKTRREAFQALRTDLRLHGFPAARLGEPTPAWMLPRGP